MASDERPLRDRKKAKTRATIQRVALQLFRAQGYEATPISQIAQAAEISESTFFRYFPTKEALVVWDDLDPLVLDSLAAQPAELGPLPALRKALREVISGLPPAQQAELRERISLVLSVHPVAVAGVAQLEQPMQLLTTRLAERMGKRPDDLAVRALVGAAVGACFSVMLSMPPGADLVELLDQALAHLEVGFSWSAQGGESL
jgi:AcrR family transcriptional regulator